MACYICGARVKNNYQHNYYPVKNVCGDCSREYCQRHSGEEKVARIPGWDTKNLCAACAYLSYDWKTETIVRD